MAHSPSNSGRGQISTLGPVIQMAFVPKDFYAEIAYWTGTVGAGPFYLIEHLPLIDTRYRGTPANIDSSVALGYWGGMQIEILTQHDAGPSIYREWLAQGREGVQHICVSVENFTRARAAMVAAGGVPVHEARMEGAAEAAYFEMPAGPIIEIAQLAPKFAALFAFMRSASRHWDGSEPVRTILPEDEWSCGVES